MINTKTGLNQFLIDFGLNLAWTTKGNILSTAAAAAKILLKICGAQQAADKTKQHLRCFNDDDRVAAENSRVNVKNRGNKFLVNTMKQFNVELEKVAKMLVHLEKVDPKVTAAETAKNEYIW